MTMEGRRSFVNVIYQGVNITDDIKKDLLSFEYTDNASGESDSVSLSLKDEKHIWLKNWFPEKGDMVTPSIGTLNWCRKGDNQILPCGSFLIDEPEYSGRPSTFTINGISSPLNSNFKDVKKSKSWVNITLSAIAGDIASRAGLQLQFISGINPLYDYKEQSETPDSTFLSELCEAEGLAIKTTDSKIVIFNEKDFESRTPITTYNEFEDVVLSYNFKTRLSNTGYAGVNVKYFDPKQGKLIEYLYLISELDEKSKIYEVNQRVNDKAEAMRLAQQTAIRLNKKETVASLSVVGNIELLGGVTVNLAGFGAFSGKYYIEKSTHSIGNGYVTGIEARKVEE